MVTLVNTLLGTFCGSSYTKCDTASFFCIRFMTYGNAVKGVYISCRINFGIRFGFMTHRNTATLTQSRFADSDTAITLRSVIEIVGVRCLRFVDRSDRYVVNRTVVHFGIQCFQLCHVDSVSILCACGYACQLAGDSVHFISDGNGSVCADPGIIYRISFCRCFCHFRL